MTAAFRCRSFQGGSVAARLVRAAASVGLGSAHVSARHRRRHPPGVLLIQFALNQGLRFRDCEVQFPKLFPKSGEEFAYFHERFRVLFGGILSGVLSGLRVSAASSTASLAAAQAGNVPSTRKPVVAALGRVPSNAIQCLPVFTMWPRWRSPSSSPYVSPDLRQAGRWYLTLTASSIYRNTRTNGPCVTMAWVPERQHGERKH